MPDAQLLANQLIARLELRGFLTEHVATGAQAKESVLRFIPEGATVMMGGSVTLEQIGLMEALTPPRYQNLRAKIRAETDPAKRQALRIESVTAPYFLSGVNAITEDGVLAFAEYGGTRVASIAGGAQHVILIASTNKIVPDLDAATRRIRDEVLPKESERLARLLGKPGTQSHTHKWLFVEGEYVHGRVRVILVDEPLGY
jgi:L-lactate utilization protein LutB